MVESPINSAFTGFTSGITARPFVCASPPTIACASLAASASASAIAPASIRGATAYSTITDENDSASAKPAAPKLRFGNAANHP